MFFGLEIGQFKISLARILLGIVLFIALLFATRVFQRWLRERSVQTRLDPSIANSVDTVVGYVGVALAALLSVSYAGLDITNLAIVAGALSVGIGFGLQSIVNNFVSGLILLIERPIKVGDRVVVGDQQGLVRRISVRATEIETLDRASLIVPNSELITGRVLNWTHRDSLGAVNVKVGVGYNSDPEQVIAILMKCAEDHPDVLRTPAPGAALESFGDSALLFNLRVSLPDIDKAGAVQSDLRVAIFKALGTAGIEIPFNQIDVNLRDLETIKAYLAAVLEQQPNGAARQGLPTSQPAAQQAKRSDEAWAGGFLPSVLAEDLLAPLVAFLGFQRKRGDRARLEAPQSDRLPGLLAVPVGSVLDTRQRRIDLGDQLALPVACPKFQRTIGLRCRPISDVGVLSGILVKDVECLAVLADDLFLPGDELIAKVLLVPFVHERLAFGGAVPCRENDWTAPRRHRLFRLRSRFGGFAFLRHAGPPARDRFAAGLGSRPSWPVGCCSTSPCASRAVRFSLPAAPQSCPRREYGARI